MYTYASGGGSGSAAGTVIGPGSSTDDALVKWDGATGALVQNSNAILLDSGNLSLNAGAGTITAANMNPTTSVDNVVTRFDGTGGKTQTSDVTIADVAAGTVAVATTIGNSLTIAATAPAAAAGASVAGKTIGVTASAAVASTDTDGAAAGGAVTITSGAAARRNSGNANGGDIVLAAGAGIGTGTTGQVRIGGTGTAALPNLTWDSDNDTGFSNRIANRIYIVVAGAEQAYMSAGSLTPATSTGPELQWNQAQSTTIPSFRFLNDNDTGIGGGTNRLSVIAGGVECLAGVGGMFQWPGESRVASNQTNATTTPQTTTLSVTLAAGRTYTFRCVLYCANSTAADGVAIDFDGGAATMTAFRAHANIYDTALLKSQQVSALATDISVAVATGDSLIQVQGAMTVNAGGTFIPRFFCAAATTGTLTLYALSHLVVFDTP